MIGSISLNFFASPLNVRRVSDSRAGLKLKAEIEARGSSRNFVVTGIARPRGSYSVEAVEARRAEEVDDTQEFDETS